MAEQESTRFTVAMIGVEQNLLDEIADKHMTRDDVALTYAFGLRDEFDKVDWRKINDAIMARWSLSALTYIKTKAWKHMEAR